MKKQLRTARAKIAPEVEAAILELALEQPLFGQDRVARELNAKRMRISASGVRYVWQRHNLQTLDKRVHAIEARARESKQDFTAGQLIAQARVASSRRSREDAVSLLGEGGEFQRSRYILATAARLFRNHGYDATSLRDIANTASIPVGSLYYHFTSKDELFGAVYEEAMQLVTRKVREAIATAREPWQRLQLACAAHTRMLCEPDDFAIAPLAARIPGLEPRIRDRLIELNDQYEDIFRALIDDLGLPKEIDPKLLRLQILGAVIWTSVWYRPGKASPDQIATNLINAFRLPLDPGVSRAPRKLQARRQHGSAAQK